MFVRKKKDSLAHSGTEVVYTFGEFTITADAAGVEMKGPMVITDMDGLQGFAETLSQAWSDHNKLRKAIRQSLAQ